MNRFFIRDEDIQSQQLLLEGRLAYQIHNVLRLKPGEQIIVLDNRGSQYDVTLQTVGQKRVTGQISRKAPATGEPQVRITLYQSLLQRNKFEWVLQKCTELGAAGFVPIVTQRTLIRTASIKDTKLTRWKLIIQEAAEQSCRGRIPELAEPIRFDEAILNPACDRTIIAWEHEKKAALRKCLSLPYVKAPDSVALFIGPEGGFTQQEVDAARKCGALTASLGCRILRTETAAITAVAIILHELGQMEIPVDAEDRSKMPD